MAYLIETGVPNPPQPGQSQNPDNSVGIISGGMLDQWSPLRLTNFYMYTYGGPGTVELLGPSSLVNSTFTFQDAPGSNLINDGTMKLQHSQLTVDGSLAGYGSVIATQGSTISADSSVPVKETYQQGQPRPDATVTAKSTYASETITLQSSTLNVGPGGPWGARVVMDAGSTVKIGNWATGDGATFHANIQDQGGQINISANAVVNGGNIGITNGSLNFQQIAFSHGPVNETQNFTSTLSFGGKSDAVSFGGLIGPLTIGVNIPLKEIAVFNMGGQIADIHLGPAAPGTYSAANFSVKGDQLIYHHS